MGQVVGEVPRGWMHELEGLANQECPQAGLIMEFSVTDTLFREVDGDDLAARNIQRGRDHGIPGYSTLRTYCGLPNLDTWERPEEMKDKDEEKDKEKVKEWRRLKNLYTKPEDIDPFPGGLAETAVEGGQVGPTFACVIAGQFRSLMKADRFFFTHPKKGEHNERGLGTSATRRSVQARRLGDIMCDNTRDSDTGINYLQKLVMESKARSGNYKQPCDGRRTTPGRDFDWEGIVRDIVSEQKESFK